MIKIYFPKILYNKDVPSIQEEANNNKFQRENEQTNNKLISYRNHIIEAKKRVNYINQIDRMGNEMQRDNLNHNTLEHLQQQINQFKNLNFT